MTQEDLRPVYVTAPDPVTFNGHPERRSSIVKKFFSMESWIKTLSKIPCSGIALGLLSGIFFATAGFIVKLVDINPIEIVISRSFVQLVIYLPIVLAYGMPITGVKGERIPVFLRGVSGFFSFGLLYVAYRMIPLADASTIVFSAPIFTLIFAWLVLKEECGLFQIFILIFTMAGVLLISRPTFLFGEVSNDGGHKEFPLRLEGTIVAVIASVFTALNFILIRRMPKTPLAVIINTFSIVAICLGVITLTITRNFFPNEAGFMAENVYMPMRYDVILWLVANGICGVLGQFCLTIALKVEEAGLVSLARTTDIVMAFLFQVIWLPDERVHWTSILGAVIVSSTVCLSATKKWLSQRPGKLNLLWILINCGHKDRQVV